MTARANLQTFSDNATEIAPAAAAIPSRNLHIRFSSGNVSLIAHHVFPTFIKKKIRYSYNILPSDSQHSARIPLEDASTANCNRQKPVCEIGTTPLVVEHHVLASSLPPARVSSFRLEGHPARSFRLAARSNSRLSLTGPRTQAALKRRSSVSVSGSLPAGLVPLPHEVC